MWYQKDWFTGSDYYNLKEKQIQRYIMLRAVTPIFGSTEINIK